MRCFISLRTSRTEPFQTCRCLTHKFLVGRQLSTAAMLSSADALECMEATMMSLALDVPIWHRSVPHVLLLFTFSQGAKKGPPAVNRWPDVVDVVVSVTDADGLDQRCAYRHLLGESSLRLWLRMNIFFSGGDALMPQLFLDQQRVHPKLIRHAAGTGVPQTVKRTAGRPERFGHEPLPTGRKTCGS